MSRRETSEKTITQTRTDYYWSGNPPVLKPKEPRDAVHGFIKVLHYQSDIVKGDGTKPTSYTGVKAFSGSGQYLKDEPFMKVEGPMFSKIYDANFSMPWIGSMGSSSMFRDAPSASYSDNAVINAMAEAANINFNALTALAEARSTADTLADLAKRVLGVAVAIKKLDFSKVRKLIKNSKGHIVGKGQGKLRNSQFKRMTKKLPPRKADGTSWAPSDLWLQYRYGIMPMVYDAEAISKALSGQVERKMSLTVRGFQETNLDKVWESTDRVYTRSGSLQSRCAIDLSVNSPAWATASESGISQVPLTGWELIPFSFVVDWALPVGKWLTALSTIPNVTFAYGHLSYKIKGSVSCRYERIRGSEKTTWSQSVRTEAYKRVPLRRIPIPLPRFKSPIRGIGDLDRVADIFALARQLTK